MRFLLLALLASCAQVQRPADLIPGGNIMCQPLNVDVERCWDRNEESWTCVWGEAGAWSCSKDLIKREL